MSRLSERHKETPQFITPQGTLVAALIMVAIVLGALVALMDLPALLFFGVIAIPVLLLIVRYPIVGLLLYLVIYLYRPGEAHAALAPLRLELLIGVLLLVIAIVQQRLRTGMVALPFDRVSMFLALFLGAMVISVFGSYEKTETIWACRDFAKILVFYLLITFLIDSRSKLYAFLFTYSLMIVWIAADSLIGFYSGSVMTVHGVDRLIGSTSAGGDPNALATTMVVSLPLVFLTGRLSKHPMLRLPLYVACGFMLFLVALTGSRGGVVALLALLFFATVLLRQRLVIVAVSLVVLPLVWTLIPDEYKDRYEGTVTAETLDQASSGRWEIWQSGLLMIATHPLTGVGAGAYAWAQGSGEFDNRQYMKAHNLFIQIAATTGIIGLVVWSSFLRHMLRHLFQFRRSKDDDPWYPKRIISQALLLGLSALLVSGLFAHNLYRYHWYLIAALTVVLVRDEHKILRAGPKPVRSGPDADSTPTPPTRVVTPEIRT